MPMEAVIWVTFLAPFVIWPPIVVAIMRRMKDEPESNAETNASTATVASALLRARTECCGASVVIALGPAARLKGREPAVACLERLLAQGAQKSCVCTLRDGH